MEALAGGGSLDQRLFFQGYLGKGVLSRARPEHSISERWQRECTASLTRTTSCMQLIRACVFVCVCFTDHDGLFLPVVTQSRYGTSSPSREPASLPVMFPTSSLSRYQFLLSWAEALLSAQGLDQQAVRQALLRLSEPVRVEDIRLEVGEQQLAGGSEEGSRSSR